ncbi:MAG: phytanoyl-CoA dioxygenase family protein [Cyclobacteriaceae bacterium]|nr:phytanoyl-CoA dioxygenase family protein [Cyclobacteriaceae bacterium]
MKAENYKKSFDEQGYIAVKGFLNQEEVKELIRETNRLVKEVVPTIPESEVYYEDKGNPETLKQIQRLDNYDDYFKKLANSEKVVGLAELTLGGPVFLKNIQYFNKIPRIGKETPAHQDGYYFKIKPQEAVTMWLSLGDADAENGAVCYIPGSQKKGMRDHGQTALLGFAQGISDWSDEDTNAEIQMEAGAGDILVHHSLTIHRANPNKSDRQRKSIGFIFYREDVEINEEALAEYKQKLDLMLKEEGKI